MDGNEGQGGAAVKKKFNFKKLLTASNVLIAIFVVLYLLDCYLPLPSGWTGHTNWEGKGPSALDYVMGSCGGLLTHYLGMGHGLGANGSAFYRHFTQMFLHGGLLHLVANAVGMYFIGNYTEKRFGRWLTVILFVAVGFTESYITDPLYLAMVPGYASEIEKAVSVGASGGVFGLIGVSLSALFFDIKSFKKIGMPTIVVSAIYGVVPTYIMDFGWTTVCHNVALVLGLAVGTAIILPFFILKKGKFAPAGGSADNANESEVFENKAEPESKTE